MQILSNYRAKRILPKLLTAGWLATLAISSGYAQANSRIIEQGADIYVDGSLHVSGVSRADRYFDVVGVSTPTVPSTNHARMWLNNTSKKVCTEYDDGSVNCVSGGVGGGITGVTAGTDLTGGGTSGTVTLNVDLTNLATSFLTLSSATATYLQLSSAAVTYLQTSSATATYLQLSSATATYLKISSATATYLQASSAPLTYLQLSSATATYLQTSSATATYLQQSSASVTYLQVSSASATYLQQSSAPLTYLQLSSATATYLTRSSAAVTYDAIATTATITGAKVYSSSLTINYTLLANSSAGSSGQVLQSQGNNASPIWATSSASAGGSSGQIQYNSGGALAGLLSFVTASSVTISTPTAIMGSKTNDSAVTGYVGEAVRAVGSAVSLTNGQFIDVANITLTAGDWDISCIGIPSPGSGSTVLATGDVAISDTAGNNTTNQTFGDNQVPYWPTTGGSNSVAMIPSFRVSISASTTYYLKIRANWTTSTVSGYGRISARRMR